MKTVLLVLAALLLTTMSVSASKHESVTLKVGQQKKAGHGEITIKFLSVLEDSRCPVGANCIWAGNAKVEVLISDHRGSKKAVMNTGTGPHGDQYAGWAINLVSLTPQPRQGKTTRASSYRATFTVERLTR